MKMQKFRIYNAYSYVDKKTNEKKVVIEALNIGKESKFPKKVFLSYEEAQRMLGDSFTPDVFGLGFRDKFLVVEEVYGVEDLE